MAEASNRWSTVRDLSYNVPHRRPSPGGSPEVGLPPAPRATGGFSSSGGSDPRRPRAVSIRLPVDRVAKLLPHSRRETGNRDELPVGGARDDGTGQIDWSPMIDHMAELREVRLHPWDRGQLFEVSA